jgi:hypothetical protein
VFANQTGEERYAPNYTENATEPFEARGNRHLMEGEREADPKKVNGVKAAAKSGD